MVHVIIPSPGYCRMLMDCVDSIEGNTSGTDYEILIVNTKTKDEDPEISSIGKASDFDNEKFWEEHIVALDEKFQKECSLSRVAPKIENV